MYHIFIVRYPFIPERRAYVWKGDYFSDSIPDEFAIKEYDSSLTVMCVWAIMDEDDYLFEVLFAWSSEGD